MIKLTDIKTSETFDLPKGVKISVELNNPMIEEQGNFTLPISLPFSKKNVRLLDFPHRLDFKEHTISREVLLEIGAYHKKGTMNIISAQEQKQISISIVFEETNLYRKMQKKTMQELFENEFFHFPLGSILDDLPSGLEKYSTLWIDHFEQIISKKIVEERFDIFPVVTKYDDDYTKLEFLNRQDDDDTEYIENSDTGEYFAHLWAYKDRIVPIDDDTNVRLPIGYNTTPFLKLNWVLRKTFELLGFNLEENMFDTDDDLKKIVLLNNVCDAIMTKDVFVKFLLPTCSVKEFINTIRYRFGCEFVLQSDLKTVKLILWNDILTQPTTIEYTERIAPYPVVTFADPEALYCASEKLNPKNLKSYKTFQDLEKEYPNANELFSYSSLAFQEKPFDVNKEINGAPLYSVENIGLVVQQHFCYDNLDFCDNPKKYKERKLDTVCVESGVVAQLDAEDGIWENTFPKLFVGSAFNRTTILEDEKGNLVKNNTNKTPLILAYSHGSLELFDETDSIRRNYGTAHALDNTGKEIGNLHLTMRGEKGLYNRFLKEFDRMLKNKMHTLTCSLQLKMHEIMGYNMFQTVIIEGVRYLPTKIQYEITQTDIKVVSAEFQRV